MDQLLDEAVAELQEWETHRKLAFQNWDDLTVRVHAAARSVTQRGGALNQAMALFLTHRLEADREYARRLLEPAPIIDEVDSLGILDSLYETQRKTAQHMDKWCDILEKDLANVTSKQMAQYKATAHKNIEGMIQHRSSARELHKEVCDDWLAHQLRHADNHTFRRRDKEQPSAKRPNAQSTPIKTVEKSALHAHVDPTSKKDLWETERNFRYQSNRCQNAQLAATVAAEEAIQEIKKLEIWRDTMLVKIASNFGQHLHGCWTEMQTITNEGIMLLSQHNYKRQASKRDASSGEEIRSYTQEIDDLFVGGKDGKGVSIVKRMQDFAGYERLPANSRFERFSGKLLRPPRSINPLGQWKEVLVVITIDGVMHGVSPDINKRDLVFSINCNDATIKTLRSDSFEIQESESVAWGMLFTTKNKIVLRSKSSIERDQWILVLQHFQSNPVNFEQLLNEATSTPNAVKCPPPPPPPIIPEKVPEPVKVETSESEQDIAVVNSGQEETPPSMMLPAEPITPDPQLDDSAPSASSNADSER